MPELRANEYMVVKNHTSTTAPTVSDQVNSLYRGLLFFININTISGSSGTAESVTVTIEGRSPVGTNEYYTILVSAVLVATGLTVLEVYPGIAETSNVAVNTVLPPTWRVTIATPSDGDQAYDYDLGFAYIP